MKNPGKTPIPRHFWVTGISWAAALIFCAALWFAFMGKDAEKLRKTRSALSDQQDKIAAYKSQISKRADLQRDLLETQAELYAQTNANLLTPLLNAYDMRAKDLLGPFIDSSGVTLTEVKERYRIPLPVENWSGDLFFMRVGVETVVLGSYYEIAEFIALAEEGLPCLCLSGFTITAQRNDPLRHRAELTFEWPALSNKPLPPPKPKTKGKRGRR